MTIEEMIKDFNVNMFYEINEDETKIILCEILDYDVCDYYWEKDDSVYLNFRIRPLSENWADGLDDDSANEALHEMHNYSCGKLFNGLVKK